MTRAASSTLTVAGQAVAEVAGVVPVGTVVAACGHGVTYWNLPFIVSTRHRHVAIIDLPKLVTAYESARRLLFERLVKRAGELGGQAVVDVQLGERRWEEEGRVLELTAVGTAVRVPWRHRGAAVATTLNAAEMAQLIHAGWRVTGVVATSGAAYVRGSWDGARLQRTIQRGTENAEYRDFTEGAARARRTAMNRAQRRAQVLGAHGVIGLTLQAAQEAQTGRQDLAITAHALGTAVAPARSARVPVPATPVLRLDQEPR